MKKILYLSALVAALITFEGCYTGRGVYTERAPQRVVVVREHPYYNDLRMQRAYRYNYRPSPVIIQKYNGRRDGRYSRDRDDRRDYHGRY